MTAQTMLTSIDCPHLADGMEGDSHDRKSPCVRRPFVWIAARRLRRFSWAGGTSTSRTRRVAAGGGLCGSAARRIFGGTPSG